VNVRCHQQDLLAAISFWECFCLIWRLQLSFLEKLLPQIPQRWAKDPQCISAICRQILSVLMRCLDSHPGHLQCVVRPTRSFFGGRIAGCACRKWDSMALRLLEIWVVHSLYPQRKSSYFECRGMAKPLPSTTDSASLSSSDREVRSDLLRKQCSY